MSSRPSTSRPRGVCKYYRQRSGCLHGDACKFIHGDGESLSPYDKSKVCKFYASGFCKRGDRCWFRHAGSVSAASVFDVPPTNTQASETEITDEDDICCICQEKPVTYGLLTGCSHICCLKCLREWRDHSHKSLDIIQSGNTKKCPYCRSDSRFITPSSVFYPANDPRKQAIMERYKSSMARIPCKYFQKSSPGNRSCPFGRDCFYRHQEADGSNFIFPYGADHYLNRERDHAQSLISLWNRIRPDPEPADVLRTLTEIRSRLESLSLTPSYDRVPEGGTEDNLISRLIEDVLSSLESAISGPSEEEEHSPPPTSSILASSEDAPLQTLSALPLTRAFMDMHRAGETAQTTRERLRNARHRYSLSESWMEAELMYPASESESSSYTSNGTSDSEDTDLEELQVMRTAGHTPPPHLLRHVMDALDADLTDGEEDDDDDEGEIEAQTSYSSRTASPYHWTAPPGFRYSDPNIASAMATLEHRENGTSDFSSMFSRALPFNRFIIDGEFDMQESTGAAEEYVGPRNETSGTLSAENVGSIDNNITTLTSSNSNDSNDTPQHEEPRETPVRPPPENERPKEFRRMKSHTGITRSSSGLTSPERETRRRRPTSQNFVTDGRGRVVATDDGGVDNALSAWFLPSSPLAVAPTEPVAGDPLPSE